jgi:chromatin remodeling complex protein RSC6
LAAAPASPSLETAAAVEEDISVTLANAITKQHELVAFAKANTAEQAANLKTIEKLSARLAKKADRRRKRKTEAVEGAAPKDCIFTKPVRISEELCSFLGKPKDTEVSRSAVTKGVMDYAKGHSLMDKQTINADASLRKLLTLAEGDKLTILNLQKFLRRHYIKATPTAA